MFNPFAKLRSKRSAPEPVQQHSQEPETAAPQRDLLGFAPQNELEWALIHAAEDASAREHFAEVLLETQLLFATPEPPDDDEEHTYVAGANETLAILRVSRDDGTSCPALFTSVQRIIETFGYGTGYVAMNGEAALDIVAADGAVLNPLSGYGVVWSAQDIARMLGRPVAGTIGGGTQVLLGAPRDCPQALVARIAAVVEAEPRISDAWLALANWPPSDKHSWYLDLRTTAPRDAISALFRGFWDASVTGGLPLDIIFRDPTEPSGAGIQIKPRQPA